MRHAFEHNEREEYFVKKAVIIIGIILLVLALIAAALWFIPRPAGLWGAQPYSEGYVGAFEKNGALDTLQYRDLGGYSHPETVLAREGWLYVSVKGGVLLKTREDGGEWIKLLDTGGCLLGFAFDREGRLIVADCDYHGTGAVLRVADDGSGSHEVLLSKDKGMALYYPNGFAIAADGTIYVTDSSSAFPPARYGGSSSLAAANEGLMHTCTGRVIAYHPETDEAEVIAEGFAFANGLGLSADEKSLFVSETYAYDIKRINLETGAAEPFLTNLPGFPDNITKGLDGRYWVGFNGERSNALDAISQKPFLRKLVWLYNQLTAAAETPNGYCHVFAFTEDGKVVKSLQSADNGYYRSTGVYETDRRLYLSSINDTGKLAYIDVAALPVP